MGRVLQERLATRRFEGPHHEAVLNVIVAGNHLRGLLDEVFEGAGLTQAQYNVLRILNGAYPGGYARGEIARRVLDRAPDLTRMLDRLVHRGLVERARSGADARRSIACITRKGRQLLAGMHARVRGLHRRVARLLSEKEALDLSRLCEKLYGEPD
jgi:DNA-binding MarR family transcriptional regulator